MERHRIAAVAGGGAAVLFAALAALHVLWAGGVTWPASDKRGLAEAFGFTAETMPGPAATLLVAALLATTGWLVAARARLVTVPMPDRLLGVGTWTVAIVLLGRAASGFGAIGADDGAARLDLFVFTPIALALGGLAAVVAITAVRRTDDVRRAPA